MATYFTKTHTKSVSLPTSTTDNTIHLNAHFLNGGVWAGFKDLVEKAYQDSKSSKVGYLEDHSHELYMVLNHLRDEIDWKYANLTDTSTGSEKTRNYPLDRAYRIIHGLVGLIAKWRDEVHKNKPLIIVVNNFADSQHLARNAFMELARRCAINNVHVIYDSKPHKSDILLYNQFDIGTFNGLLVPYIFEKTPSLLEQDEIEELMSAIVEYDDMWENRFLTLLRFYSSKDHGFQLANIAVRAACYYNHFGYYYESASMVNRVMPYFNDFVGNDEERRWNFVGNMFQGLVTTGEPDRALALILEYAKPYLKRPDLQAKMNYLLSMTYLRYLDEKDIQLAEEHIVEAVRLIAASYNKIPDDDYYFLKVFIDNGLAFLKVRQNQPLAAIELCQAGYQLLTKKLNETRHDLHRSVLLYNSAQVYSMMGEHEEALAYYKSSIEIDPYYSEYYNEIGNIYQQLQNYELANQYYDKAIEYSAPYSEVYFNKGVGFFNQNKLEEAIASFNKSEDINPCQAELFLTRAEAFDELGDLESALRDYTKALEIDAGLVAAYVNRANVYYQQGRLSSALADLEQAYNIDDQNEDLIDNLTLLRRELSAETV